MKTYNYIYLITNNINGKIYVGKHSTDNLNDCYMGSGKILKLAYNKYGVENFTKKILAFADTEEKLNWFERFYIKKYHCRDKSIGYNLTDGGDGTLGFDAWNKGKRLSDEHKRRLSEVKKGTTLSDEHKRRLSESKKGKPSPNKGKIGVQQAWNKGVSCAEETKRKISESKKGKPSPNKGKPMSEEQKRKISESRRGKPMSEEQKHKISESMKRKREVI